MSECLTVSVEEAGKRLGISRGLAYTLVGTGEIPSLRLGRRLVVPVRALEALLDVKPPTDNEAPAAPTPLRAQASSGRRRARSSDVALPFTG